MLALRLDCSTAALTTPQKVLPIRKLVELKMLEFSDSTRTGISILTLAVDLLSNYNGFLSLDYSTAALSTPQKVSSI